MNQDNIQSQHERVTNNTCRDMVFLLETSINPSGIVLFYYSAVAKRRSKMLETIAILLIVVWALGLASSVTLG